MTQRQIKSSGRIVITIEEQDKFYVLHRSYGNTQSVSGPYHYDDRRFVKIPNETC